MPKYPSRISFSGNIFRPPGTDQEFHQPEEKSRVYSAISYLKSAFLSGGNQDYKVCHKKPVKGIKTVVTCFRKWFFGTPYSPGFRHLQTLTLGKKSPNKPWIFSPDGTFDPRPEDGKFHRKWNPRWKFRYEYRK